MRSKREVKKEGKVYLEEYWIKEPNWIDTQKRAQSNSALIYEMEEELKKFKK